MYTAAEGGGQRQLCCLKVYKEGDIFSASEEMKIYHRGWFFCTYLLSF